MMYDSDYDVHYTFVDHMNVATSGSSYTNWYNKRTGNSGIIHTTSLYYQGSIKCVDYDVTVDIRKLPVSGMGNVLTVEFNMVMHVSNARRYGGLKLYIESIY